jgi:hypothetical protein
MIFDLDPSGGDFAAIKSTAQSLKHLLEELELPAHLKTTGSRGLHVAVPLNRKDNFDSVRVVRKRAGRTAGERKSRAADFGVAQGYAPGSCLRGYQPECIRTDGGPCICNKGPARRADFGADRLERPPEEGSSSRRRDSSDYIRLVGDGREPVERLSAACRSAHQSPATTE